MSEQNFELRPYQKEALETIDSLPDGSRSICCLATGLGKTVVAANISHAGRVLWLSHRDELVRQPEKYFVSNGFTFGIEKADEHGNGEDVISASVQSLYRDERLYQYNPDDFELIICDEAHHAAAPSYQKILSYFTPRKLIGLTATPQRGDNLRLTDVFDSICFIRDLRWGIENGYLSRIRCIRVQAEYDMNHLKKYMGDFSLTGLEDTLRDSDADIVLTKAYIEHCLPEHRQTLIYCPTVNICNLVMCTMKKSLPEEERDTVRMLWEGTSPEERKETLNLYKEGKVHAIINCMILTEGTDLPNTTCIINNRPTANATLYQQIIGRGTRLYDGKDFCLIIDVIGQNTQNKSLCTAPTLFGIDPELLPQKIREEFSEKKDLIEICDEISEIRAATAKSVKLQQEMIDIFTQERINLIRNNSLEGYKVVADTYNDYLQSTLDNSYDFGDILVKQMFSDKCYYKIEPTYHGVIYLSKPDALENTVIDVSIPAKDFADGSAGYDFISEPMPIDKAIAFVYDFLKYCIPFYYITKWSKSGRESMTHYEATEKQIWRVKKDYRFYGIKPTEINRLQASDLIDLLMDISKLRSMKTDLAAKESEMKKKRKGKALTKWTQKQEKVLEKEYRETNQRKQNYDKQLKLIMKKIEKGKQGDAAFCRECTPGKPVRASITINYKYFPDPTMPSAAQISYADSLLLQIQNRKIRFNYKLDPHNSGIDKGHFSFVIDFLINLSNKLQTGQNYITVVNLKSVIAQINEITPSNRPEKLTFEYILLTKEEIEERIRKHA